MGKELNFEGTQILEKVKCNDKIITKG